MSVVLTRCLPCQLKIVLTPCYGQVQQERAEEEKESQQRRLHTNKQRERALVADGKKPFYLKKGESYFEATWQTK